MTPVDRTLVIGDALIDEIRGPDGAQEFVGGSALNVAVGLARLGTSATLITELGDDGPGDRIRSYLSAHEIPVVSAPGLLGTARAISERTGDGEPTYSFNDAARNRSVPLGEATRSGLDDAELVVVSGFPFDDDRQVRRLLDVVADAPRRLIIDPNPRAGLLRDRERFIANLVEAGSRALLVKVGDEDAHLLIGQPLDALVERFHPERGPTVLATRGRLGASIFSGTVRVHAGITDLPGRVIDTMGAGDASLAAVVHRLATRGLPLSESAWEDTLASAMAVAAATVRSEGALLQLPVS